MLGWRRVVAVKQMDMTGWVEIEENISLMWCTMMFFFLMGSVICGVEKCL